MPQNEPPKKLKFLVERYWPGLSRPKLARAEEQIRFAVQALARRGREVRVLSTTFIPAEEVVLTLFEASREEDVIEVNRVSEVPFDRVQCVEVTGTEEHS